MAANPQVENGFTRIANEILENVYTRKFTANQLNILMFVWRYTYGFKRKEHEFSLNFIKDGTGMDKKSAKRALDHLIDSKVIKITKEADFNNPRKLAFNKNYEEWQIDHRGVKKPQSSNEGTVGEDDHSTVGSNDHSTVGSNDHQERNNLKKIYKENNHHHNKGSENPFSFYERNGFGTISPYVSDEVNYWLDGNFFEEANDIVVEAMKEAVRNNKKSWKYCNKCLMNWSDKKLKTLNDVQAHILQFTQNRQGGGKANGITQNSYAGYDFFKQREPNF